MARTIRRNPKYANHRKQTRLHFTFVFDLLDCWTVLNVEQLFFSFNIFASSSIIWLRDSKTKPRKKSTTIRSFLQLSTANKSQHFPRHMDSLFYAGFGRNINYFEAKKASNYFPKYSFQLKVFVIFSWNAHIKIFPEIFAIWAKKNPMHAKIHEYLEYLRIFKWWKILVGKPVRFYLINKKTQCGMKRMFETLSCDRQW